MIDNLQQSERKGTVQTDLSVEIVREIDSTVRAYL